MHASFLRHRNASRVFGLTIPHNEPVWETTRSRRAFRLSYAIHAEGRIPEIHLAQQRLGKGPSNVYLDQFRRRAVVGFQCLWKCHPEDTVIEEITADGQLVRFDASTQGPAAAPAASNPTPRITAGKVSTAKGPSISAVEGRQRQEPQPADSPPLLMQLERQIIEAAPKAHRLQLSRRLGAPTPNVHGEWDHRVSRLLQQLMVKKKNEAASYSRRQERGAHVHRTATDTSLIGVFTACSSSSQPSLKSNSMRRERHQQPEGAVWEQLLATTVAAYLNHAPTLRKIFPDHWASLVPLAATLPGETAAVKSTSLDVRHAFHAAMSHLLETVGTDERTAVVQFLTKYAVIANGCRLLWQYHRGHAASSPNDDDSDAFQLALGMLEAVIGGDGHAVGGDGAHTTTRVEAEEEKETGIDRRLVRLWSTLQRACDCDDDSVREERGLSQREAGGSKGMTTCFVPWLTEVYQRLNRRNGISSNTFHAAKELRERRTRLDTKQVHRGQAEAAVKLVQLLWAEMFVPTDAGFTSTNKKSRPVSSSTVHSPPEGGNDTESSDDAFEQLTNEIATDMLTARVENAGLRLQLHLSPLLKLLEPIVADIRMAQQQQQTLLLSEQQHLTVSVTSENTPAERATSTFPSVSALVADPQFHSVMPHVPNGPRSDWTDFHRPVDVIVRRFGLPFDITAEDIVNQLEMMFWQTVPVDPPAAAIPDTLVAISGSDSNKRLSPSSTDGKRLLPASDTTPASPPTQTDALKLQEAEPGPAVGMLQSVGNPTPTTSARSIHQWGRALLTRRRVRLSVSSIMDSHCIATQRIRIFNIPRPLVAKLADRLRFATTNSSSSTSSSILSVAVEDVQTPTMTESQKSKRARRWWKLGAKMKGGAFHGAHTATGRSHGAAVRYATNVHRPDAAEAELWKISRYEMRLLPEGTTHYQHLPSPSHGQDTHPAPESSMAPSDSTALSLGQHRHDEAQSIGTGRSRREGAQRGREEDGALELSPRDLWGFQYTLRLRNILASDVARVRTALQALEATGFLNYFGGDHFDGSARMDIHPGLFLLKGQFRAAVNAMVKLQREDWDFGSEEEEEAAATAGGGGGSNSAATGGGSRSSMKEKLLEALRCSIDRGTSDATCQAALMATIQAHGCRRYVNQFLAFCWNAVVSQRVQRHGHRLLVGDMVRPRVERAASTSSYSKSTAVEAYHQHHGDGDVGDASLSYHHTAPVYVTQQDLDDHRYDVTDLILPIPGCRVELPKNDTSAIYLHVLSHYGIDVHPEYLRWVLFEPHEAFDVVGAAPSSANAGTVPSPMTDEESALIAVPSATMGRSTKHNNATLGNPLGMSFPGGYRYVVERPKQFSYAFVYEDHVGGGGGGGGESGAGGGRNPHREGDDVETHHGLAEKKIKGIIDSVKKHQQGSVPWLREEDRILSLQFQLPASSFVSSLMRELTKVDVNTPHRCRLPKATSGDVTETANADANDKRTAADKWSAYEKARAKRVLYRHSKAVMHAKLVATVFRSQGMRQSLLPSMHGWEDLGYFS